MGIHGFLWIATNVLEKCVSPEVDIRHKDLTPRVDALKPIWDVCANFASHSGFTRWHYYQRTSYAVRNFIITLTTQPIVRVSEL